MAKLQAMMEDEMDRLEEVVQQLEDGVSMVMDMLSGNDETRSKLIRGAV
jgi:exonuclease VII small subunit